MRKEDLITTATALPFPHHPRPSPSYSLIPSSNEPPPLQLKKNPAHRRKNPPPLDPIEKYPRNSRLRTSDPKG